MNKKKFYIGTGIAVLAMLLLFFIPKYMAIENINFTGRVIDKNVEKIEVIHFHGTHQCNTCIAVGKLAEETINESFKAEVESGKISFKHINGELPENSELVKKYGVTSASLWIGIYTKDGFHPEENVNVWYKIDNPEEYKSYLTDLLVKRFKGDFS
jgi:hypothetical protein